jgi:hypothetical protein
MEHNTKYKKFWQYITSSKMLHKVVHITYMYSTRFISHLLKSKGNDISNYIQTTIVGLIYEFTQEIDCWQC